MKAFTRTLVFTLFLIASATGYAQKKVTGIVFKDGKPAAGIAVDAHRTNDSYYTSFDGKYEININAKTKWIRFTWGDDSKRMVLDGTEGDVINFSFDGSPIPEESDEPGVILKSIEKLSEERDRDFLNNFSLYREYFRQENYDSGKANWRVIYKTYPKSTVNIYIDGIRMYENYLDKALNPVDKIAYLDTIMQIYDKRMKYFDNGADLLGRKAAKYLETILTIETSEAEMTKGIKTGLDYAQKAIDAGGNQVQPAVLVLWMQASRSLFSMNKLGQEEVLENYEKANTTLENQLKDDETKEKAEQAIPLIHQIIEASGALDCNSMANLYGPKFKNNPNDIDLVRKMLAMLRREGCTDSELFIKGSEKQYELQPSAESALNMARMFLRRKEFDRALVYYKEAYEKETDIQLKATIYYEAGMLSLQQEKNIQARDLVREAIKLRPDYCEALMLMGEIYAQSSRAFSDQNFERSTIFWLATDYYERATRVSACKSEAENKVRFYNSYFPGTEEIFFRELSIGQRYNIGGWINETTTVRAKQ